MNLSARLPRFLKNASIYLTISVVSSLIKFVVIPVLSHYLDPAEFGVIGIFQLMFQFMTPLVGLSMNFVILKSFYTRDDFNGLVPSFLLFSLLFTLGLCVVTVLVPETVYELFDYTSGLFLLTLLCAFISINMITFQGILQMMERPLLWGGVVMMTLIVEISFTFLLLIPFEMSFYARIYGILLGNLVGFGAALYLIREKFQISRVRFGPHVRYLLVIGAPLLLATVSTIGLRMFDRLFIQQILDMKSVGIYAMAYTLASPLLMVGTAFSRAWGPKAYKELAADSPVSLCKSAFKVSAFYLLCYVLLTTVGRYIFGFIIADVYLPALNLIPWIAGGMLFFSIYKLFAPYLIHGDRTAAIFWVATGAFVVNVLLNLALIGRLGLVGAGVASVIGFFVMAALTIMVAAKQYRFFDLRESSR